MVGEKCFKIGIFMVVLILYKFWKLGDFGNLNLVMFFVVWGLGMGFGLFEVLVICLVWCLVGLCVSEGVGDFWLFLYIRVIFNLVF